AEVSPVPAGVLVPFRYRQSTKAASAAPCIKSPTQSVRLPGPLFSFTVTVPPPFTTVGVTSNVKPTPETPPETSPAVVVKLTIPAKVPTAVGVRRTTTAWLAPAARLNEPPEKMLYGGAVEAVPVRVPCPVFWTVKVRSAELPTATLAKSWAGG